jgi:ABC-type nitrate/sulfonate/bicarbonate transport system substrate-binding protein
MRIVVPDLITNSYFPALAAETLGFFQAEGVAAHVELLSPAPKAMAALRDGAVEAVAIGAHTTLSAFPYWQGAKLVVALAQGTPWLLVVRADLPGSRGDVQALKGLRIGAAPGPDAALRYLLAVSGLDPQRDDIHIGPVPGAEAPDASFGMLAARALESHQLDGFWANALGSEAAIQRRVGKILLDVRRGDGPAAAGQCTFSTLVMTEALIASDPERVAAVVQAIVRTQQALRHDPTRATEVGQHRFPPDAAALIATLVERDLPFYNPVISESAVAAMQQFAQALGLLPAPLPYEHVVAVAYRPLWQTGM